MNQQTRLSLPSALARGVVALSIIGLSGCVPIQGTEFRNAALPAIETGVNAILDGLVTGVFAVIEPQPQNVNDSNRDDQSTAQ